MLRALGKRLKSKGLIRIRREIRRREKRNRKEVCKVMAVKKSLWDMILKVVIAVASAVLGVVGGNAMNL
jgi:uncharacterized membrane protein